MARTRKPGENADPEAIKVTETVDDGKIWYRKVGGGSMRLPNKIIKPGEKFRSHPDDIPRAFRDLCIPLEEVKEAPAKAEVKVVNSEYFLQPRGKNKQWWDVVKATGEKDAEGNDIMKAINENALKKDMAEKLISDLSK